MLTPDELIERIARVAHETSRALFELVGYNGQPAWNDLPPLDHDYIVSRVRFCLRSHRLGMCTPPPSVPYGAWLEELRLAGWKHGLVLDAEKKQHPGFAPPYQPDLPRKAVPYEGTPFEQQMKDHVIAAVVRAFFEAGVSES